MFQLEKRGRLTWLVSDSLNSFAEAQRQEAQAAGSEPPEGLTLDDEGVATRMTKVSTEAPFGTVL